MIIPDQQDVLERRHRRPDSLHFSLVQRLRGDEDLGSSDVESGPDWLRAER
jgi:hypothetical protein